MKIFVIAPGIYFDGMTGDSTHLSNLWNSISNINNNDSIHIFASIKKKKLVKKNKIKFHNSFFFRSKISIITAISLFVTIFLTFFRVGVNIILHKPDLLYSRHQIINPFLLINIFTKKTRTILEINGFFYEEVKVQKITVLKHLLRIIRFFEKKSFDQAGKILVVSELMKDILINNYGINGKKINVISNGVDTNIFFPEVINPSELGLADDNQYACFVGNLIPWQGLEIIIHAASQTIKNNNNLHYLIVGDGILRGELENLSVKLGVNEHVHFIGSVKHEEVAKYINVSKICLAPFVSQRNKKVGFSAIKIFEYLACGKPVITTNLPGNNLEIVQKNNFGKIIDPDSSELLDEAINLALNDEIMIENTKKYSSQFIRDNYSWDIIAKKVYNEINLLFRYKY